MKLDLSQFKSASFPIWERDFTSWYLLGAVFMVLLGVFYALRRWPIITRSGEKNITISRNALLIELNEQEVRLLKLLLAKSENGENSNIDEINYVLGIKDKNMGIQKKVRSDVINRLNQKYALLSGEGEHLISSIRSEEDKRYFEYFIVPEKLPVIKGILQSKAADSTP